MELNHLLAEYGAVLELGIVFLWWNQRNQSLLSSALENTSTSCQLGIPARPSGHPAVHPSVTQSVRPTIG